jgi:hypothetical protein
VVADQPEGEADQVGAKLVGHGRYVAFQMAEVAVTRNMFAEIPTDCGTAAAATSSAGLNGPAA